MAAYADIRNLMNNSDMMNRTSVAVIIAANGILEEVSPTPARTAWANRAFQNPQQEAKRALMAVLAANNAASVAQITGASDTALQNNVNAAIDLFIAADAGV